MQNRIKEELKEYYRIEAETDIKVNTYGLTGAGVMFLNSTLKIQVRFNNAVENFRKLQADLVKKMKNNSDTEDCPLILNSWFIVKHVTDQHLYMKLVSNDYNEEYNGAVFKIKFQHMRAKREIMLSKLLNSYMFLDK